MKIKYSIILFYLLLVGAISLNAQSVETSYNADSSLVKVDVKVDVNLLQTEDQEASASGNPMRVALVYPLKVDMKTAGKWIDLADGTKVWKLTIEVPNSYGLILNYDDFYLPEGASLFIYGEDGNSAMEYTREDNETGGFFITEIETSNTVSLEYVSSESSKEEPRIKISDIGFKYKDVLGYFPSTENNVRAELNDSRNHCIPNINCVEGRTWQTHKKGVAKLLMRIEKGYVMCTGSLINNTRQDLKPYLLTAHHCLSYKGEAVDLSRSSFAFNYEFPGCANLQLPPRGNVLVGAELRAISDMDGESDGALLEIKKNIPESFGVYYNGWDRTNEGSRFTSGAVIQHPHGDVKKIALYKYPLVSSQWRASDGVGAVGAHWRVKYWIGVSQEASSGSPIFNQEGLIVGSLTGGSSSCERPDAFDYYGKMWYHWDQSSIPSHHMKKYLDPDNTGVETLKGTDVRGGIAPPPEVPDPDPNENKPIDKSKMVLFSLDPDNKNIEIVVNSQLEENFTMRKIQIVSAAGNGVYMERNTNKRVVSIDTDMWNTGLYILKVWTSKGPTYTRKIFVVNQ